MQKYKSSQKVRRGIKQNGHIIIREAAFLCLAQRQDFCCCKCRHTEIEIYSQGNYLEIHHKVPLNQGGTNHISNLQLLCSTCHIKLHKTLENYWVIPEPVKPFPYVHLTNQIGMSIL